MIQLLWLSLKNFRLLIQFFILSYFTGGETEKIFLFTLLGELPSIDTGVTYSFYGKASSYRKGSEQAHLLESNHIEER